MEICANGGKAEQDCENKMSKNVLELLSLVSTVCVVIVILRVKPRGK